LSAIAFVHKINGWNDPTNSFIVKKLKEGSRRLNGCADSRRPITFVILKRLVSVLGAICKSSYEAALFKAAFCLAFFGFLRVGEFTCSSKNGDTSRIIDARDLSFRNDHTQLVVVVRFSKTDQSGKSETIVLDNYSEAAICPVNAIRSFFGIRPQVAGPLFLHFGGDPLTGYQLNRVLRKGLDFIGLPAKEFSSHSFRIGAATSAAMCGASDERIKIMGRWKSSAFESYIRPSRLISFL
jgi:hypothetical protein